MLDQGIRQRQARCRILQPRRIPKETLSTQVLEASKQTKGQQEKLLLFETTKIQRTHTDIIFKEKKSRLLLPL